MLQSTAPPSLLPGMSSAILMYVPNSKSCIPGCVLQHLTAAASFGPALEPLPCMKVSAHVATSLIGLHRLNTTAAKLPQGIALPGCRACAVWGRCAVVTVTAAAQEAGAQPRQEQQRGCRGAPDVQLPALCVGTQPAGPPSAGERRPDDQASPPHRSHHPQRSRHEQVLRCVRIILGLASPPAPVSLQPG